MGVSDDTLSQGGPTVEGALKLHLASCKSSLWEENVWKGMELEECCSFWEVVVLHYDCTCREYKKQLAGKAGEMGVLCPAGSGDSAAVSKVRVPWFILPLAVGDVEMGHCETGGREASWWADIRIKPRSMMWGRDWRRKVGSEQRWKEYFSLPWESLCALAEGGGVADEQERRDFRF